MGLLLLIVLVLLLMGGLPTWGYSRNWGYGPSGGLGLLLVIVLVRQAFDQEAAMFVHEWFGFVTYSLAIGCMLAVGHWLREGPPRTA